MRPLLAGAALAFLSLVVLPVGTVARAQAVARAQSAVAQPNVGSADSASRRDVYTHDNVDLPAQWHRRDPADGPAFPANLRLNLDAMPKDSAGYVLLVVVAEFEVDSTGHADIATFNPKSSPDPALSASVKNYLRHAHYDPAELGDGRHVRQLVSQPFLFRVRPWGLR
jgi:hypothetical protein